MNALKLVMGLAGVVALVVQSAGGLEAAGGSEEGNGDLAALALALLAIVFYILDWQWYAQYVLVPLVWIVLGTSFKGCDSYLPPEPPAGYIELTPEPWAGEPVYVDADSGEHEACTFSIATGANASMQLERIEFHIHAGNPSSVASLRLTRSPPNQPQSAATIDEPAEVYVDSDEIVLVLDSIHTLQQQAAEFWVLHLTLKDGKEFKILPGSFTVKVNGPDNPNLQILTVTHFNAP